MRSLKREGLLLCNHFPFLLRDGLLDLPQRPAAQHRRNFEAYVAEDFPLRPHQLLAPEAVASPEGQVGEYGSPELMDFGRDLEQGSCGKPFTAQAEGEGQLPEDEEGGQQSVGAVPEGGLELPQQGQEGALCGGGRGQLNLNARCSVIVVGEGFQRGRRRVLGPVGLADGPGFRGLLGLVLAREGLGWHRC